MSTLIIATAIEMSPTTHDDRMIFRKHLTSSSYCNTLHYGYKLQDGSQTDCDQCDDRLCVAMK